MDHASQNCADDNSLISNCTWFQSIVQFIVGQFAISILLSFTLLITLLSHWIVNTVLSIAAFSNSLVMLWVLFRFSRDMVRIAIFCPFQFVTWLLREYHQWFCVNHIFFINTGTTSNENVGFVFVQPLSYVGIICVDDQRDSIFSALKDTVVSGRTFQLT